MVEAIILPEVCRLSYYARSLVFIVVLIVLSSDERVLVACHKMQPERLTLIISCENRNENLEPGLIWSRGVGSVESRDIMECGAGSVESRVKCELEYEVGNEQER